MSIVSNSNLERYADKQKEWATNRYMSSIYSNYQLTEKAKEVSFYPVGDSPLDCIVDFMFTEIPPTNNEKSPDNPSTIVGVNSIDINIRNANDIAGRHYTIDLGGIYYGGSVDLAAGVMTVTHSRVNLIYFSGVDKIGSNGYATVRGWFNDYTDELGNPFYAGETSQLTSSCSIAPWTNEIVPLRWYVGNLNLNNNQYPIYFVIHKSLLDFSEYPGREPEDLSGGEVRDLINAYLANHPFTMIVKRKTPYTVQLTPVQISALTQIDKYTPKFNTVYSTGTSVQIGYRKSPIREEYEIQQAIAALGGV